MAGRHSVLIVLGLLVVAAGCGKPDVARQGQPRLMAGTMERGTEGGLFLVPCGSETAVRLYDPEGYLDGTGGFASIYTIRENRDGREGWTVRRVNYVPREGFGCGFDWQGTLWRAAGNEPFWAATVTEDGLTLLRPGVEPRVIPVQVESGPVFSGQGIEVRFEARTCVDSMADTNYGWVVTATMDGQAFRGCGFQGLAAQTPTG